MTFNMKSIAAAVMLTMAGGGAQAAIVSGYGVFTTPGDGELFISIFRNTASPESMLIDTNVSLFGLQDHTVSGWTATPTQTAAISAFLGTASISDFLFNAGGVTNQLDIFDTTHNNDVGFFVTTNSPVNLTTSNFSTLDASSSNINAHIVGANNKFPNMAANGDLVTGILPGQEGYARDPFFWSTDVGNTYTTVNTEAAVGTPLKLWNFRNDSPNLFEYQLGWDQVGTLNIDGATGVASLSVTAVPVPAAAWLFGSGLVGLVGIARRKKA